MARYTDVEKLTDYKFPYITNERYVSDGKRKSEEEVYAYKVGYNAAIDDITQFATSADVQEVRHGKWVQPNWIARQLKVYICSVCNQPLNLLPQYMQGDQFDVEWNLSLIKYCPNCGSKNDAERGNDVQK